MKWITPSKLGIYLKQHNIKAIPMRFLRSTVHLGEKWFFTPGTLYTCSTIIKPFIIRYQDWGRREGTVVIALNSHQCGLGSILRLSITMCILCGLRLMAFYSPFRRFWILQFHLCTPPPHPPQKLMPQEKKNFICQPEKMIYFPNWGDCVCKSKSNEIRADQQKLILVYGKRRKNST